MKARLLSLFGQAGWRLCAAVGALLVLLYLPGITLGPALDDHLLRAAFDDGLHVACTPPFDLYSFFPGDSERLAELKDSGGYVPWWSDPDLKARFLRPLTSLTLSFDHQAHLPYWLRHLHSLFCYGALLWAVALLYRLVLDGEGRPIL